MEEVQSTNAHRSAWVWYWAAVACGVIALGGGVGIFLLWFVSRWTVWMVAGMAWLKVGLLLFAFGCVFLLIFILTTWEHAGISRRRRNGASLAAGAVLVSCFPVALGIVAAVHVLLSMCVVHIHNRSSAPLEDISFVGYNNTYEMHDVRAERRRTCRLYYPGEGDVVLHATLRGKPVEAMVFGYVTTGMGGQARVVVYDDGSVNVHPCD